MSALAERIFLEVLRNGAAQSLVDLVEQDDWGILDTYDRIDLDMVTLEREIEKAERGLTKAKQGGKSHHVIKILSDMLAYMCILAEKCHSEKQTTEIAQSIGISQSKIPIDTTIDLNPTTDDLTEEANPEFV